MGNYDHTVRCVRRASFRHLLPLRLREERFGDVITPIPAGEESAIRDGVNVAALAAASTMI